MRHLLSLMIIFFFLNSTCSDIQLYKDQSSTQKTWLEIYYEKSCPSAETNGADVVARKTTIISAPRFTFTVFAIALLLQIIEQCIQRSGKRKSGDSSSEE